MAKTNPTKKTATKVAAKAAKAEETSVKADAPAAPDTAVATPGQGAPTATPETGSAPAAPSTPPAPPAPEEKELPKLTKDQHLKVLNWAEKNGLSKQEQQKLLHSVASYVGIGLLWQNEDGTRGFFPGPVDPETVKAAAANKGRGQKFLWNLELL